jgi:NAD(P)-dependent dehydrogenase (short-subunit alcohol dehydrogenase family)
MLKQDMLEGFDCRASIINISSLCQTVPMNNFTAYSASKAGVLGMSKCDAFDYGPDRIRVNCIAPGNTVTPMLREYAGAAGIQALADATPLRRNATPEDIANAIVWLSSSRASFITGTTLTVDGGYNLRTPSFE